MDIVTETRFSQRLEGAPTITDNDRKPLSPDTAWWSVRIGRHQQAVVAVTLLDHHRYLHPDERPPKHSRRTWWSRSSPPDQPLDLERLTSLIPWLTPPADELARLADMLRILADSAHDITPPGPTIAHG